MKKILVANRGEIAVRVIRTCRDMEIKSVAVYDESDVRSLHVLLADESVPLDSPRGYTDQKQIIDLAISRGCDAIHPGYSFLSENAEFAEACEKAGLIFIGPSVEVLKKCASKIDMLQVAESAGLKVPRYKNEALNASNIDYICRLAEELTYPVALKPYRGNSGRTSRVVERQEELERAVDATARESLLHFNDARIYLEKAIQPGKTVQIPFLADHNGNVKVLNMVDVAIHRNFTRMMCETPTPGLGPDLEEKMAEAVKALVKKLNYNNQGAVEFWVDEEGNFYFTTMLSSIQIEHSVTEMVTGLDLVAEQIKLCRGEAIPDSNLNARGFAMQSRIYAEDLLQESLPSPGTLKRFRLPGGPNVRVDAYAYGGCPIPIHFDPLLATIAVWAPDRDSCLRRMRRALRDTAVSGVKTNLAHMQAIMHDDEIARGRYNSYTGKRLAQEINYSNSSSQDLALVTAIAYYMKNRRPTHAKPERLKGGWYQSSRRID